MKNLILLICSLIFIQVQAQFSIKSGDEDVIKHKEVSSPNKPTKQPTQGTIVISSNLKTKNSNNVSPIAIFELYVLREETKVTLNLTIEKGEIPMSITVERKGSSTISEYGSFKEFTAEDLLILEEDKKIIFYDNYPEPRKEDSYYRIIYEYADGVKKFSSGVQLPGQFGSNDGIYGDHEKDESLFVNGRQEEQAKGVEVIAERSDNKVSLVIINNNMLEKGHQVSIERKTSDYLATFRSIKLLTEEELNTLISSGQLIISDKYPPSYKIKTLYRVAVSANDEVLYEFPAAELVNLN